MLVQQSVVGGLASGRGSRSGWWLVVAMALVTYLAMLDMTVVTVALPMVTEEFGTTPAVSEWLVVAYLLPLVGLSLPAGRWVDGAPWRASLQLSLSGFAASSLLVAVSPSVGLAIGSRALQGACAALLFSLAPAVAAAAVPASSRGRAMGVIAMVGPLGGISGYAAGAVALDSLGWRSAFYLNVPVTVVVLVLVLAAMPADVARLRPPSADMGTEATMLLLAAGAVFTGLSLAASGSLSWLALPLAAVLPLAVWARGEQGRRARDRLSAPRMRQPHLSLLLEASAFGGATFTLPFLLGAGGSWSARSVGFTLTALPLASVVGSLGGGVLADRVGPRVPAVAGAALLGCALAFLARADPSWRPTDFAPIIALAGAGAGCFSGANQTLAMTAARPGEAASVGASTNVARQFGFALGPALATTIWALNGYRTAGLSQALVGASFASLAACLVLLRRHPAQPPGPTTRTHSPGPIHPDGPSA